MGNRIQEWKRLLSFALAVQMILSNVPFGAFAKENGEEVCVHHPVHTAECGYVEAVAEVPCKHLCEEEVCVHVHDEICGYVTAVEGSPCAFFCAECNGEDVTEETTEETVTFIIEEETSNPYAGKTIACIGDSITYGVGVTRDETDYVTLLAKALEMDYIRLGVSGTTLCTDGPRTCNIGKLTEANLSGADVVTIMMGINDFCAAQEGDYTLGTVDSMDTSTIYGAAHMWCQKIVELRQTESLKNTEFYFMTPVITSWNNSVSSVRNWDQAKENIHGYTLRDLCNGIIEVCARYDIPVIDLNLVSGLYYNSPEDNSIDKFGGDGVHPGTVGHQMMAEAIENVLLQKNLWEDHTHTFGSWITTDYPTCRGGMEKRVCSVCSATESRALESSDKHSYEAVVMAPTCTEQGYTTYTCECGDSYVIDFEDAKGHSYVNGTCTLCGESLAGKTISILGDSISTYRDYSNGAAAAITNSTISGGAIYYPRSGFDITAENTWWYQAARELDMEILVNNSWSGSCLLNTRSGTVGAYVDRCVQLHDDTGENAAQEPDIIAVYLGTNDYYTYPGTLGSYEAIDFDVLISQVDGAYSYATPATSLEAYAITLHKISQRYPNAEVYCFTLLPRVNSANQPTAFNEDVKQLADYFDAFVVDLFDCGINAETEAFYVLMGDSLHPNSKGMDAITGAFTAAVLKNSRYLDMVTHDVSFELSNVVVEQGTAWAAVEGQPYRADLIALADGDFTVTVTMGGIDITEKCYSDGRISIEAVTGDLKITAEAQELLPELNENRELVNFRWEYDEKSDFLISVTANNNTENALSMTHGTITDGAFSKTRFTMSKTIMLNHDQPWSIEWKSEGTWSDTTDGALLFAEANASATENRCYLYRRHNNTWFALGIYENGKYHNYGASFEGTGIDTTEEHVYRLTNRIEDDGSNMVYLYVDNVQIGAMNHHYIAGTDQKETSNWVSGKDFHFSYMGTTPHTIGNCAIDYIQVWEAGRPEELAESMVLRYDDHYDIIGKEVEIIDAGKPTSYQVGYGVEENAVPDTAVVTVEGNYLVATGIGTAMVKIDGTVYEITVTAAPISLLLLAGQSNMQGIDGDRNQSVICPTGQVYATYADRYQKTVEDVTKFAPSALAGAYSTVNVTGDTSCLAGFPVNMLTEAGNGREGMDSGLAYEWVRQTGEKVWVINLGYGGSSITQWQKGGVHYEVCYDLFTVCQETLRKEIAAGHFTFSHMGYFWCQGCADETQTAQWYAEKFLAMHTLFKEELAFGDKTFEFAGIIPIRSGHSGKGSYRAGVYDVTTTASYYQSFKDLRFNGPRVAQYWMGNNPKLTDIWNVCTIQEAWATMPDGTDGVADYFHDAYENGKVDYPVQVSQSASWYTPTTPAAVHDNIHYNQIGYNEIGRESARNALILLKAIEEPEAEATVKFIAWDGFTPVTQITASMTGNADTLVVPMVSPVWKAKEVTYAATEGLRYDYYDLLTADRKTVGTLSAVGAEGTVVVTGPHEHIFTFPGTISTLCSLLWR